MQNKSEMLNKIMNNYWIELHFKLSTKKGETLNKKNN